MSDHIGRSWSEHPLEDACPCPQEACGLVAVSRIDPACHQHALAAGKTIRQSHTAERCTVTAPTSPKPHTPADLTVSKDAGATLDNEAPDAGLRTALTKLARDWDADAQAPKHWYARELRALLAAHPAPETARSGHDIACDADYLDASCICDELTPAPVSDARRPAAEARCLADTSWKHHDRTDDFPCSACSSDTRREDVARALRMTQATHPDDQARLARWWDEGLTSPEDRAVVLRQADAVLAVLPAPPVVDVNTIRQFIAEEFEFDDDLVTDQAERLAARLRGATRA